MAKMAKTSQAGLVATKKTDKRLIKQLGGAKILEIQRAKSCPAVQRPTWAILCTSLHLTARRPPFLATTNNQNGYGLYF